MTKEFSEVMPGMSFNFGLGLRGIPLTIGLGYQQEFISSTSWSTNKTGLFIYNDQWSYGTLHLSRDLDVRHFDAVLHLEPEWHRFRPFIEVLGGTSQIFCDWSLSTTYGSGLTQEHTGGLTWTWGYGAGIRIEPFRPYADKRGSLALVVSLGVRRRLAGKLRFLEPHGNALGGVETVSFSITEPKFDVIQPYLFIGIVSRSP
jgi:hypothetical protein